jgi:hypothetical protein
MKCNVCDGCGEVYRKEGMWCKDEEIIFGLTRYHLGNGMNLPTGRKNWMFCSLNCFKKWFDEKMKEGFKEVSKV